MSPNSGPPSFLSTGRITTHILRSSIDGVPSSRNASTVSLGRRYDSFGLDMLVRSRDGVVLQRELLALGMSSSTIAHRTRPGGPWQRLLPGVLLVYSGSASRMQRLRAGLVYAGPNAMFTGVTALRGHGVRKLPAEHALHLLVPHSSQRSSCGFVILERTRRMPDPLDIVDLPWAPVARATIDGARRIRDLGQVRALLSEVVQRGRCSLAALGAELRDAQIRGTALPRLVLREVSDGVRSAAEGEARELISSIQVAEPLWNQDIFDAQGRWIARPDAVWIEFGVVLEIDSMEWHLSPVDYQRTQTRHRRMTAAGLLVIHVSPSAVRTDPSAFVADLRATLEAAASRPAPAVYLEQRQAG